MISLDFDWQTNEFMLYCRTTQLREKSMMAYEQSLKLFQRWCMDEMGIFTVDKVTENVIRRYIVGTIDLHHLSLILSIKKEQFNDLLRS